MRGLMLRWLVLTLAIMVASFLMGGIEVSGVFSAFWAAAWLGVLNALLRPVLLILTLPLNVLSFGLFTFVINALLLQMVSGVIEGFVVRGFWSAVFGSLVISLVSGLMAVLINDQGRIEVIELRRRRDDRWE